MSEKECDHLGNMPENPLGKADNPAHFDAVYAAEYVTTEYLRSTQYDVIHPSGGIDLGGPVVMATMAEPPRQIVMAPPRPPARLLPIALFCITCLTTLAVGLPYTVQQAVGIFIARGRLPIGTTWQTVQDGLFIGFQYAGPLMLILLCHEMGHYIQARRNRIPTSLPYFIPMPNIFGTMGAVIAMRSHLGDRRTLFDIGISGPLAGLVPTLIFLVIGIYNSTVEIPYSGSIPFGEPLLVKWLVHCKFGDIPPGYDIILHPMAFAAWVGLLITSLNLIPIGQLDGGHILHALAPRAAAYIAQFLLFAAAAAAFYFYTPWMLMILLLFIMGPKHPPTADDRAPIGRFRIVLGWLTLAFIVIGFTPFPIKN